MEYEEVDPQVWLENLSQWSKLTPEYVPCCQNCHSYHLTQIVGHDSGSWHTRLQVLYCTLISSVKSHALSMKNQSTELSHLEHFITCHTPFASSEVIVELLIGESTDTFAHAKHFLLPVSSWSLSLTSCYSFTCTCCMHHAMQCWLLTHQILNLGIFGLGDGRSGIFICY